MANFCDKLKCHYHVACLLISAVIGTAVGESSSFEEFRFVAEPSDTIVIKDSPALLDCSAAGDPPPVIRWWREGKDVEFSDRRRRILANGSLYFESVVHTRTERPDEGLYQCSATQEGLGTIVSRSAKLQVASLPRFDHHPEDIRLFPGQTAYFQCSIQAVPPATILWLKDEQPLKLDRSRMTQLPSGALEVDDVQPYDAGFYQCNSSNVEKFRLSNRGVLTVSGDFAQNKPSPPTFVAMPPKSSVVVEGESLTLDCVAVGNPRPKITWLKDGTTIDLAHLDSRFSIMGSGSLHIEKVEENDSGVYMCRAENSEDSVDSSATVAVHVPPRFTRRPENRYAFEKEDIEFPCEVYGLPPPTVQWVKNGELLIATEYFQIMNSKLRILGLVKSDAGIYQCFASNPSGNIQASVQLIILEPGFTNSKDTPSAPRDLTAIIVSTRFVALSWKPPIRTNGNIFAYSVYFRESTSSRERVVNTTRHQLEEISIPGLAPDTKYVFQVVAYNQHGPGQYSEKLTLKTQPEVEVPSLPRGIEAIPVSATSILVKWQPPDIAAGPVEHYRVYYMEDGTSEEHELSTVDTSYLLTGLKKFAEYTIWVIPFNQNGAGPSTKEIAVRTYPDVPGDTPQNVTLEPASSSSIIVRWEPPPKESQNGVITGYKIRYKLKSSKKADIVTTDGKRRLYALTGLERGAQYNIKIAALSLNGSGPFTEWMTIETYHNDLNESRVPDQPSFLRARPSATSVFVSWGPPRNQNIMVRGYTIGWGIGLPDVYTQVLDGKQRHYKIENLSPSSEYVISLRAHNKVGDGQPIYETVKTLVETTPEPVSAMSPPVGLKAIVLSSTTVVLYWTDSTLSRNQIVTDNRYYTVRYSSYRSRYRYFNSTDLNCMINDLKPNTQYEFAVKVIKGRRESTWSMSVFNTTQEAAPSSPPRDLTIVPSEEDSTVVNLHWQPPKQPNGQITGYVIFYTTDNTQKDRDWVVEGVVGDKMTTVLKGLTGDTTYYFKIQARNGKGYGPLSSEISFHSPAGVAFLQGSDQRDSRGLASSMLYIIIACVSGGTLIIIIIVTVVMCKRRHRFLGPVRNKNYKKGTLAKGKAVGKEIVPPDLWIHHDQMELKSIDKASCAENNMTVTPIQRNSQELGEEPLLSALEKKKSAYLDSLNEDNPVNAEKCLVKCQIRATPLKIPLDVQKPLINNSCAASVPSGISEQSCDTATGTMTRPMYPRTQYNIPRNQNNSDVCPTGSTTDLNIMPLSPHIAGAPYQMSGSTAGLDNSQAGNFSPSNTAQSTMERRESGTLTKRPPGHPLRSFSVPAPPPQSAPATPQPKHFDGSLTKHSVPHTIVQPSSLIHHHHHHLQQGLVTQHDEEPSTLSMTAQVHGSMMGP